MNITTEYDKRLPQRIGHYVDDGMLGLQRWDVWRYVDRGPDKKPAKRPRLKTNQPDTWLSFDAAVRLYESGQFNGIGFLFADDGYVGIDFDDCTDPATNEINQWARKWMDRFNTYTEVSISGSGMHSIAKGQIPEAVKRDHCEMYQSGRFFVTTGYALHEYPLTIAQPQMAIGALFSELKPPKKKPTQQQPVTKLNFDDEKLLNMMTRSRSGDEILSLINGTHGIKNASVADIRLCNHLAFWTQKDRAQMKRIFEGSALVRPKWTEKRGQSTYGDLTLDDAIENCPKVYEQRKPTGGGDDIQK